MSEENRAELPDRRTAVHHLSGHRTWIGARGTRGSPAGAEPHTQWLAGSIELDDHGFIVTGPDPSGQARRGDDWQQLSRDPYLLETTLPGVFAAGDVRSGSVKRVTSAVGEGSIAVRFVSEHLGRRSGLAATGPTAR